MAPKRPATRLVEDSPASEKSSKVLKRTPTDEVVKKALKDNFKGAEWSPDAIYYNVVDGKNLFEFLKEKIHEARTEGSEVKRGSRLYAEAKEIYSAKDSPTARLRALIDDAEPIQECLIDAMLATKRKVANHTLMQAHLQCGPAPSGITNMVAICRWALTLNALNDTHRPIALDFVRYQMKHKLQEKFPLIADIMRNWCDELLVMTYVKGKTRSSNLWARTFLETHRSIVGIVLPMPEVEKLLACSEGASAKLKTELKAVVNSSGLGEAIFGPSMVSIASDELQELIETRLLAIEADTASPINQASVEKHIMELMDVIAAKVEIHKYLPTDREVIVKCPGV